MKTAILFLCSALVLSLGACATNSNHTSERQSETLLDPMSEPEQKVGNKWHGLMNGQPIVVTTLSLDRGILTRRRSDGCEWTGSAKGFAPAIRWSDCEGVEAGTQRVDGPNGEIWPLRVGNNFNFPFRGSRPNGDSWQGTRHCEVESQVHIDTVTGGHDTFKVVCEDRWTKRTWYLSPKIGRTVCFVRLRKNEQELTIFEMTKFEMGG